MHDTVQVSDLLNLMHIIRRDMLKHINVSMRQD